MRRVQDRPAVGERSDVRNRHVRQEGLVVETKLRNSMEPIELEPRYSGPNISGKCLKCLAEQKLDRCFRELLNSEGENPISQQQFEALVTFLRSPESEKLRTEAESLLSDGKQVKLKISYENDQPTYELKIN